VNARETLDGVRGLIGSTEETLDGVRGLIGSLRGLVGFGSSCVDALRKMSGRRNRRHPRASLPLE
jgi:hypothetical protein